MAAPLDRKPIVLLPMVYLLWAAARAGLMRDWLRSARCALDRPRQRTRLPEAHRLGKPLLGPALDFFKFYDRLPLAVFQEVAAQAGVLASLAGPMLACSGGPGVPAPLDCRCEGSRPMGKVALCWSAGTRSAGCQSRDYMDDPAATSCGPQRVGAMTTALLETQSFVASFRPCLSPEKCARFATAPCDRAAVWAHEGPLVVAGFRNLGSICRWGGGREPARPAAHSGARSASCGARRSRSVMRIGCACLGRRLSGCSGLRAVMRSTFRIAPEACGCLAARRWRDDAGAWAVVAP